MTLPSVAPHSFFYRFSAFTQSRYLPRWSRGDTGPEAFAHDKRWQRHSRAAPSFEHNKQRRRRSRVAPSFELSLATTSTTDTSRSSITNSINLLTSITTFASPRTNKQTPTAHRHTPFPPSNKQILKQAHRITKPPPRISARPLMEEVAQYPPPDENHPINFLTDPEYRDLIHRRFDPVANWLEEPYAFLKNIPRFPFGWEASLYLRAVQNNELAEDWRRICQVDYNTIIGREDVFENVDRLHEFIRVFKLEESDENADRAGILLFYHDWTEYHALASGAGLPLEFLRLTARQIRKDIPHDAFAVEYSCFRTPLSVSEARYPAELQTIRLCEARALTDQRRLKTLSEYRRQFACDRGLLNDLFGLLLALVSNGDCFSVEDIAHLPLSDTYYIRALALLARYFITGFGIDIFGYAVET